MKGATSFVAFCAALTTAPKAIRGQSGMGVRVGGRGAMLAIVGNPSQGLTQVQGQKRSKSFDSDRGSPEAAAKRGLLTMNVPMKEMKCRSPKGKGQEGKGMMKSTTCTMMTHPCPAPNTRQQRNALLNAPQRQKSPPQPSRRRFPHQPPAPPPRPVPARVPLSLSELVDLRGNGALPDQRTLVPAGTKESGLRRNCGVYIVTTALLRRETDPHCHDCGCGRKQLYRSGTGAERSGERIHRLRQLKSQGDVRVRHRKADHVHKLGSSSVLRDLDRQRHGRRRCWTLD